MVKIYYNENEQLPIPHYYGDIIRKLFFMMALIMLLTLPFFHNLVPFPLAISVLAILILVVQAGVINPKSKMVITGNFFASLSGFLIFEFVAVTYFSEGTIWFGIINQILAILSFTAVYYSTKTFRAYLLKEL